MDHPGGEGAGVTRPFRSTSGRRRSARLVPVSKVLGDYLQSSGLDDALERTGLLDDWAAVVGGRIAAVTRAAEVRGDTLIVEVASSAWLNELTMMRNTILEQINGLPDRPSLGRIRFRLAPGPEGGDPAKTDVNQSLEGRHG